MNRFCMETFLKELEVLVNIDSGFGAPDGATQVGLLLAEPLVQQGWILERHRPSEQYGEVIVLKNRQADHYDVLMVGHTDTVFPAGEALKRPFTRDEKRAYGVGVLDMKQGCLAMVHVLKRLPETVLDKLNIAVVFNPDEETSSPVSKKIIDEIACCTEYGMVFEASSTAGPRCIQRKGMIRLHVAFHGKAGHSGYAFENGGINAVHEMAYWICEMTRFHSREKETTVNAGVARGGQAANIIADYAELALDIRYESMREMERITAALDALKAHAKEQGVIIEEKKRTETPRWSRRKRLMLCAKWQKKFVRIWVRPLQPESAAVYLTQTIFLPVAAPPSTASVPQVTLTILRMNTWSCLLSNRTLILPTAFCVN